jgi:hypothetical protein
MNNILSNHLGIVMTHVKQGAAWIYKQDYAGIYASIINTQDVLAIFCVTLVLLYLGFLYMLYTLPTKARPNKRKFEEDPAEEQNRHIKRRLSIQAEKYRHASAFQTILQQVGEDPRSWPVILLNEVVLLREDLARVQKKSF